MIVTSPISLSAVGRGADGFDASRISRARMAHVTRIHTPREEPRSMVATTRSPGGLASVVIPCFNQLEFTRHCLAALVRHTRPPWELVVVDNGSTDGTADYLRGVRGWPGQLVVRGRAATRGLRARPASGKLSA
jgi:hypothetical protein